MHNKASSKPTKFDSNKANELDDLLLNLYPEPADNFDKDEHIFSLSMLDGYLTAVLLCPDMIDHEDWLEGVWQEDALPQFKSEAEKEKLIKLLIAEHSRVKKAFANELTEFEPLVYHEMHNDQALPAIDLWLDGFERGFEYFVDAWILNPQIEAVIDDILGFDDDCDFEHLSLDQRNKSLERLTDLIIQLYALICSNPNAK
ncbi:MULTISPECIES: UPF0149 family protein [Cysteiniphilum]|uniref:UPF0149 family protein n=1 Tax=Cysteiniphilum TaxID=2056696 RepID=UPI0017846F3F|nr:MULTISPECIES: UPF0149 family protein [Cysteiniphilum]